jgi:hypothetical protein
MAYQFLSVETFLEALSFQEGVGHKWFLRQKVTVT